ncbi:E3 ubiquitin-protein ligase XBAT33, partial [Cucurbita argyrosperma subsp. argyrosperma]
MGNSFGCSASGERLVSAARDGDLVEAKMLLDCNPYLAKYTFGGLNSPLHFAAAKGHNEIVSLLLENGADVNSRNYCGQTAVMQACRYGHWEVVQTLLIFRCNVMRADYLSGRTALHFAAINGHVKCLRLIMADFVPSVPYEAITSQTDANRSDGVNILLARGASRMTLNCNGWLPLDVARMWGRHWLEPLLAPNSDSIIPRFPTSNHLLLPLMSALNIARECGFKSMGVTSDDGDTCAVCLERVCSVAADGCGHELCVKCALYLCSTSNIQTEMTGSSGSIPCPLCRHGIISFVKLSSATEKEKQLHLSLSICNSCILHNGDAEDPVSTCLPDIRRNRVAMISSDVFCPVTCSPFHSSAIPVCTCNNEDESHRQSQTTPIDQVKLGGQRPEKTCCSSMFCGRRSCSRENQCNSEINA